MAEAAGALRCDGPSMADGSEKDTIFLPSLTRGILWKRCGTCVRCQGGGLIEEPALAFYPKIGCTVEWNSTGLPS